jgi:pilus assembly protein CpaF
MGHLQALLDDTSIQRILVDGASDVKIVRAGRTEAAAGFADDSAVQAAAAALFAQVGAPLVGPFAEANLADGSRVHFVSASVGGPYLTIDRPQIGRRALADLVAAGVVSDEISAFLGLAMRAGRGVVVASNDVDARIEFMNALASDAKGLRVIAVDGGGRFGRGVVTLTGGAGTTPTEVVQQALKMHPDRLFVADCRGPETFHAISALAGAVDGGVVGITAESPDDAMIRILRQAATAVPTSEDKIGGLVREAVDVMVQLLRYADGKLMVTQVLDLDGEQTEVFSGFSATGHTPRWVSNAQSLGHAVDLNIFR